MCRRLAIVAFAVGLGLWTFRAQAADPVLEAHAIMRQALSDRAVEATRERAADREAAPSAGAAARQHADRVRRSEAERAAHRRALEHGSRRSGAGRPDREMHGAPGGMHGGGMGDSWGMDCQDAAGNRRSRDMHDGGMPHDGMPGQPTPGPGMKASPERPSGR